MCREISQKYVLKDGVNKDLLNILFPNNQIEKYGIILEGMPEYHYFDKEGLKHSNVYYLFRYMVVGDKTEVGLLSYDGFHYFFKESNA